MKHDAKPRINKKAIESKIKSHSIHELPENLIRFSFKFIHFSDKFGIKNSDENYFKSLLERLKDISALSLDNFKTNKSSSLRAHKIEWSDTSEKNGFTHLNAQLQQCEPWQFQISKSEHGRIHGILIDEVFYIIWFDPKHKLYS